MGQHYRDPYSQRLSRGNASSRVLEADVPDLVSPDRYAAINSLLQHRHVWYAQKFWRPRFLLQRLWADRLV
jgi:hypothetical protein